jgi:hypothetical protein
MWNIDKDTSSISRLSIGTHRTPMFQFDENIKCFVYDIIRALTS